MPQWAVSPPKPRHLPIAITKSKPSSSAIRAASRFCAQPPSSGGVLRDNPATVRYRQKDAEFLHAGLLRGARIVVHRQHDQRHQQGKRDKERHKAAGLIARQSRQGRRHRADGGNQIDGRKQLQIGPAPEIIEQQDGGGKKVRP